MAVRHRHGTQSSVHIAGHPVHPMVVSLPVASFIGLLLTDLAWLSTSNPFWAEASWWLLVAGLVTGLLAGLIGAIDYSSIPKVRQLASGKIHAGGNIVALVLAGVNLGVRADDPQAIEGIGIILSVVLVALLAITAWLGGELSFRHRIGVAAPGPDDTDS
jgi:uncharacterized membrane protein